MQPHQVNGQPGAIFRDRDGKVLTTWALDVLDGQIQTIRAVNNPDKLGHVGPVADAWAAFRRGGPDGTMRRRHTRGIITIGTNAAALAEAPLRQARNSAAFWPRPPGPGREVIRRAGFPAVAGDERAGLRILIQEPGLGADEVAELTDLAGRAAGPVEDEDPFSSTDLGHLGMRTWQMPVMLRPARSTSRRWPSPGCATRRTCTRPSGP